MVAIAGQVAGHRGRGLPHARLAAIVAITLATAVILGALLALGVLAAEPRVVVPVGGMIVSAAMQAAILVLLRLRESVTDARPAIEARLCLGLPAPDAFAPCRRGALRTALIPAIDATKVVGLISLPGAMTGLILAGTDPLTAIRYQIVVMYMLLAATTLAALVTAHLAERTLFDQAHRLRPVTTRQVTTTT
jgi:putative ABC transport system permease protein